MDLKLDIERCSLTVTIQKRVGGDNKRWTANSDNSLFTERIIEFGRKVVNEALSDDRIILDGIYLNCTVTENDILKSHGYRCPDQDTSESLLAETFLAIAEHTFKDQDLTNYIELLEGYFGKFPAKLFDETPKRLRFYNSLSIYEMKGTEDIISKVANEQALVLDLTNLRGMGTVLYNQFECLKSIPELKVLVMESNDRLLKQVKDIGFSDEQIQLLSSPTP